MIDDPNRPSVIDYSCGVSSAKGFSKVGERYIEDDPVRGTLSSEGVLVGDEGTNILFILLVQKRNFI